MHQRLLKVKARMRHDCLSMSNQACPGVPVAAIGRSVVSFPNIIHSKPGRSERGSNTGNRVMDSLFFTQIAMLVNKKAQLSLTNPRDACEKFARLT